MTTTSIPLSELPSASDNARRDQYGRYLIVPPGATKSMGYTRVTTVAKALDDGGGLAPWKATMTACGLIMRRGLRAQWEALLAEHGDPWYGGGNAKAACKRLVEECAAVGGANDRKEMGSALHTITALVDIGRQPHLTEETERSVIAYQKGLADHNVKLVDGAVELTVVLDEYQVAGTFDRLAHVPGFRHPLIADLKTGGDLSYSWQSIAVQLAAYSRANAIYHQGTHIDGSEDRREMMPVVEQDWGLILWLNVDAEDPKLELYLIDLRLGWQAFEHSMWTRGWRNRRDVATLYEELRTDSGVEPPKEPTAPDNLLATLEASIAAIGGTPVRIGDYQQADQHDPNYRPRLRAWLQQRIEAVGDLPSARADLNLRWPPDLSSLRSSGEHTDEELAVIEKLLDDVEAAHQMPFPASDRPQRSMDTATETVLRMFPNSAVADKEEPA